MHQSKFTETQVVSILKDAMPSAPKDLDALAELEAFQDARPSGRKEYSPK